jgi:hypothetical protein
MQELSNRYHSQETGFQKQIKIWEKNPVEPKLAHLLKTDNTVDSKLRNWYLHKYVRCYKRRNQFCVDKQMLFLSASF